MLPMPLVDMELTSVSQPSPVPTLTSNGSCYKSPKDLANIELLYPWIERLV